MGSSDVVRPGSIARFSNQGRVLGGTEGGYWAGKATYLPYQPHSIAMPTIRKGRLNVLARPTAATNAGLRPAPREDLRPSPRVGESAGRALTTWEGKAGCADGV